MLENILSLIKGPVMEAITSNQAVPENKKPQAIEATTSAFAEGLKQNATPDNLAKLAGLLNGGSLSSSSSLVQNMEGVISGALTQKVGLSQGIAATIATAVVPMVMSALSGKIKDPNEKGFNLESVLGSLTGGKTGEGGIGGVLGSLGHLFG